jgi:DNA primase
MLKKAHKAHKKRIKAVGALGLQKHVHSKKQFAKLPRMSIPQSFLDEIRNRLTLSEVIGKRVSVTRAGREFKACCPFHREKTPSFTINDDKQFYHCFGCGAHGDVLGFVMQNDGLNFIEAVEMLSADAGLTMPKPDPMAVERAEKTKDLYALMDEATSWMQAQITLAENAAVLEYLEKRGLNQAARDTFRIGYAPHDGQALRKHLKAAGYNDQEMISVGLAKESARGGEPYIFFRERVMFPVLNRQKKVVAFGGRVLPEHMQTPSRGDYTPAKYINTAETVLFDKGRMLYGEPQAREASREGHTLIVTEGYMDVIACYMAGFKGAVAPMGTALTDDQIMSLWSMQGDSQNTPVLCFDGDNAGRRAGARACENLFPLLKAGKSARFAFLPEGEDPDTLLRASGREGLRSVLMGALSMFDFMWMSHTAGRKFDTPEARAGLTKALNGKIAKIGDGEVQKHYRELVKTRISETFFTSYNNRQAPSNKGGSGRGNNKPHMKKPSGRIKPRAPVAQKTAMGERILMAAILNNPAIYNDVEELLGGLVLGNHAYDQMRQRVLMIMEEQDALEEDALRTTLIAELRSQGFAEEIGDIACESVYVHAAFSRIGGVERIGHGEAVTQWKAIYDGLHGNTMGQEVKQGWMNALENADEAEEGRLKDMVQSKAQGEHTG